MERTLRWTRTLGIALCLLAFGACGNQEHPERAAAGAPPAIAGQGEDGQWPMAAKDYANTRFSGLEQIDTGNVSRLEVAWTFSTGLGRGHEAAPLIVGSTMYIVTPFPNQLSALDLTRPGAPVQWVHRSQPAASAQEGACCAGIHRGAAYADGRIFYNTWDHQTVALDAETGQEIWTTRLGEVGRGESLTMAPLVVKGKVLVGNSGGEPGVRGWLTAIDAASGRVAWRASSTGPDQDVLIGPGFQPFYAQDRGEDLGVRTWPSEAWKSGGGTVWGWISYDPELDLIYHGTGNPGPSSPDRRKGDNKWTAGVFARDPDTGEARWFYQWSPHDLHGDDGVNENVLLDLRINGRPRQVMVRPERNGYVYVLDRVTGEVLSADPFVHITTTKGIDLKSGRPIPAPAKEMVAGKVVREICPASPGAKDWQPSAYSPRTGLLYMPHNNLCQDAEGGEAGAIAGTSVGDNVRMYPGPGGNRGVFTAWDPVGRRPVWSARENFPAWSGALVTAGDVVFYGTLDGWFKALDARNGKLLWRFKAGSGIIGQPVSYRGPDGRQYVAMLSGQLDPRDATALQDLPDDTTRGGRLYVFALP